MTTHSIPTTRRLLLLRRSQVAAPAGAPRRYRLARLDLGPPHGRGRADRFAHLKRSYD
jgi:hypothetical protein